ncbi:MULTISPECIES: hypothetical protein [Pseudomonas syringae group]|uniref:Addiction module antidote protein n=2 Tax=Pseudomonas syringae group genomosp. 2 TaxID=251698 RepID=A0A3M4YKW0_PSESG|nr:MULTISPECIES: hypothetical protein [Pseudomonas syringae group]KPB87934.1 Uncharacterized protein AC504_4917 [Pseudomonas syringae pv. maculicola]AQL36465.1 hypothetical protein JN853_08420 [Pseudomonas syringae pv. actinidiae ICMP 9853]EGH66212.1 hypothetical protein PSYAC_15167 [Pseudomonas syringae pv. actinidiae str. M302091]EPM63521.1 hypothetical protein A256_01203 [Pseudomonas syringae pv. actinidiae ICMP 19103]EPM90417.1 hypothetical protein A260_01077 [Pseudomonas syringae pv. acti
MKDRSHDEVMTRYFRANPAYAEELLAEVCRNGDIAERQVLLRQLQGEAGQSCVVTDSLRRREHE